MLAYLLPFFTFAFQYRVMLAFVELITRDLILKFLKFGLVGFSGVFVDFTTTFIFKEWFKVQRFVSNAIGFTIAATSNYYLNRIWTFESHNPRVMVEFGQFFLISMIGLGINTLIIWILDRKFQFNFYVAKLVAIGVVTIWNFIANSYITFA